LVLKLQQVVLTGRGVVGFFLVKDFYRKAMEAPTKSWEDAAPQCCRSKVLSENNTHPT